MKYKCVIDKTIGNRANICWSLIGMYPYFTFEDNNSLFVNFNIVFDFMGYGLPHEI